MHAELFAQVYANPADDDIRRILADALLADGDPRGELILYQLVPDADHALRAMKLIQQYGLTWLGPLRGAVIPLRYERGFLAAVQVIDTDAANATKDHPMWNTVEDIELDRDDDQIPYFITRSLLSLRVVRGAHKKAADHVRRDPPPRFERFDR